MDTIIKELAPEGKDPDEYIYKVDLALNFEEGDYLENYCDDGDLTEEEAKIEFKELGKLGEKYCIEIFESDGHNLSLSWDDIKAIELNYIGNGDFALIGVKK
jgi:hypothetical protein